MPWDMQLNGQVHAPSLNPSVQFCDSKKPRKELVSRKDHEDHMKNPLLTLTWKVQP